MMVSLKPMRACTMQMWIRTRARSFLQFQLLLDTMFFCFEGRCCVARVCQGFVIHNIEQKNKIKSGEMMWSQVKRGWDFFLWRIFRSHSPGNERGVVRKRKIFLRERERHKIRTYRREVNVKFLRHGVVEGVQQYRLWDDYLFYEERKIF